MTPSRRPSRRIKWNNELHTLPRYDSLVKTVTRLTEPTTTTELAARVGLDNDRHGVAGALYMLEALGQVHAIPGSRKARLWHSGKRPAHTTRPASLPPLLPYQRIIRLLQESGRTPIGTAPIVQDVHLGNRDDKNRAAMRRVRGALKVLVVMGLAGYDHSLNGWYWTDTSEAGGYRPGRFGR